MTGYCCVCHNKNSGFIDCGEFVCFTCHYEATGEKKKTQRRESIRCRNVPVNRGQIRDNLIAERLKNKIREGRQ